MQLRLKLTEDQVIAKMMDFYQKFQAVDPSKAVPDFPMTPAYANRSTSNSVFSNNNHTSINEVNESLEAEEEEAKVAVPVAVSAEEIAKELVRQAKQKQEE